MNLLKALPGCFAILIAASLSGCSSQPAAQDTTHTAGGAQSMQEQITAEARRLDKTLEDGWIVGRDPRTFKTPYRETTAEKKAQFAMDYAAMIGSSGQNLAQDWHSYLPYSKRANFALEWWQDDPEFKKLDERKQNIWVHEALLDGSELYWRIFERNNNPGNEAVIAHDVEQNMVCKFMENDRTPGTWGDFRKTTSGSPAVSQK